MSKSSESGGDGVDSVLDILEDWYHVPVLLVMLVAMMAIRLQPYSNFIRDGEVFFSGNDAWYHLREVNYTVRNWPATMPFDPWTYFPYGTSVGQFGTLYDQLVATAALILGLGSPGQRLVAETLLVAPAVFGALAVIPTYYIGKRLGGRIAGLFGAAILALLPGSFLSRSIVGVSDHNGAEPLFLALAVLTIMIALRVAERDMPIWELVVDRDIDALGPTLFWGAIAGVAVSLYMWVWPPGVMLLGIFGIFLVLKMSSDVVNGHSPEPVAFVATVAMSVTAVLMLVPLQTLGFTPTQFSLVQPFLALTLGAGSVFLAWLARQRESRDVDASVYPIAVLGLIAFGFVFIYIAVPDLFRIVQSNILRIVGFSAGAKTRTIGEAQPMLDPGILRQQRLTPVNRILTEYGFAFFTAVAAVVWMIAKPLVREGDSRRIGYVLGSLAVVGFIFLLPDLFGSVAGAFGADPQLFGLAIVTLLVAGATVQAEYRSEHLFVIVWAAFLTSMAFTQLRFNYYLAVAVAVVNAYLFGEVLRYVGVHETASKVRDLQGYQILALVATVMLVLAPVLVVPLNVRATGNAQFDRSSTAWETAQNYGPGDVTNWEGTLEWMSEETPPEGTFGGGGERMAYYGTYSEGDGDFDYSEGAYGVMSWWDYGHWITVKGERIPNANPFQQGAISAANYLLAPSEEQANEVLAETSADGEETRYVMVDWKMVTTGTRDSKFGAPIVFYDEGNVSQEDFLRRVYSSNLRQNTLIHKQRFYESTMVRLYYYHGSARDPSPIVVDWEPTPAELTTGETVELDAAPANASLVKTNFNNMSAARAYVEEDGSAQIGGIGAFPSERVPALEHYRLVKVSNRSALDSGAYQQGIYRSAQVTGVQPQFHVPQSRSWVKAFERVPGATVEGSGAPANSNVTASVELRIPTTNETFTYRQRAQADENGEFSMVLPYSTTGYDEYGPENGYTNVSVRATGPYRITGPTNLNESGYIVTSAANVSVSEGSVVGETEGPTEVTLERRTFETSLSQNRTDANTTANDSAGNSSALAPVDGDVVERTDGGAVERTGGGIETAPSASTRRSADVAARP